MENNLILKITNHLVVGRDLLLDELNDEIESDKYDVNELDFIVSEVLTLLSRETNHGVRESAMNLLSTAYSLTDNRKGIENFVSEKIDLFDVGCLVHALSIVAESTMFNRDELLHRFENSENKSIKNIVSRYLVKK